MTEFKILRTNHTGIIVSDLDRSIAFFRDALGFEVTSRAPRDLALIRSITGVDGADVEIAYIRGPDHNLELIQYLAPADKGRVSARQCDTGLFHVAFDVDVKPEVFDSLKESALKLGFDEVASGPLVRSSYHAGELYDAAL